MVPALDLAIRPGHVTVSKDTAWTGCLWEGIKSDQLIEICDGPNVFEAERRIRRAKSVKVGN